MARRPTGQLIVRRGKRDTTYAARIRAGGARHYVTLGYAADGWNEQRAQEELANILADVRRGIWTAPAPEPEPSPIPESEPTFHVYSSEWVERRQHEVDARTSEHWRWALSCHLLPFLKAYRPSQITGRLVDAYKLAKLREREELERAHAQGERLRESGLSNSSINKTLKVLAQILEDAVEDGYLDENPARGKRRRLKASKPRRTWLELGEVKALIDAAADHRALIATMVLAGLRVSELILLRWRDVDLARGKLQVADSKTDAGHRTVDLSPWLTEELATHKAGSRYVGSADFVFATRNGTKRNRSNITRQILRPSIDRSDAALTAAGLSPIQSHVTNHSLRRTFASLLYEAGATPAYVMAQMGHESSALALEVYAKVMERKRETGARMDELVRGADWSQVDQVEEVKLDAAGSNLPSR